MSSNSEQQLPSEPGPSRVPPNKFTKDDSFFKDLSSIRAAPSSEDTQLAELLDQKKFERRTLLVKLMGIKDMIIDVDATKLSPEQVSQKLTAIGPLFEAGEAELAVLSDEIDKLALRLRREDADDTLSSVQHRCRLAEARVYFNQLKDWVASSSQQSRSRALSAEDVECVQSESLDRLESTPVNPPPQPSDDGVRFRYSFMDVASLARDGSGQWIRNSQSQQAQPAQQPNILSPQRLPFSSEPPAFPMSKIYFPPSDPNRRLQTRHPIAFSGVTSDVAVPVPPSEPPRVASFGLPEQFKASQPELMGQPYGAPAASRPATDLGGKARQVPVFSGDVTRYREWQQLFKIFVDDTAASTIEKFNMLRLSLSGRAKDAIAHLSWEEGHYQIAKGILQDEFGDGKLAQKVHVNELISLVDRGQVSNNRLESFSDTLSLHVRALIAMGLSFAELIIMLTQRALQCLPSDLREKFVRKYRKQRLNDPLMTELEFLMAFLELTVKDRREAEWDLNAGQGDRRRPLSAGLPPGGNGSSRFRAPAPAYQAMRSNHAFFSATEPSNIPAPRASAANQSRSTSQQRRSPSDSRPTSRSATNRPPPRPPTVNSLTSNLRPSAPSPSASQRSGRSMGRSEGVPYIGVPHR